MVFLDKFRGFVEENPDFADDYLHTESVGLQSGPCHDNHTQTNPSTVNLQGTANNKTANGICPDFSPKDHDRTADALMKKHNWEVLKSRREQSLSWWEEILFCSMLVTCYIFLTQ